MLNLLAAGACGYFSGKIIHKVSGYKLGTRLLPYVLVPLLIGLAINPAASPCWYLMSVFTMGVPFNINAVLQMMLLPAMSVFTILIPLLQVRGR